MRGNKPFTNTTFTKRVDHEAGRHHTKRAPQEPAVCSHCGALYVNRRWSLAGAGAAADELQHRRAARPVTCPACKQKHSAIISGFVNIDGDFFISHRDQIERLLRNEAARAAVDNPLAQIISWQDRKDGTLALTTTTEHLAQRLGHALAKAFHGSVDFDFSHENKVARVTWRRD